MPIVVVLLVSATAYARADSEDCTLIGEREARLACYDRLHGRTQREESVEAVEAEADVATITAQVVSVGRSPTGRQRFQLDNGQLWEQVTAQRTDVDEGDQVKVRASAIGTFHLRRVDGGSRSSQVRRLD